MEVPNEWFYRYRGVLMVPPYLFFLFTFVGETEHTVFVWPVGLAVFFLGVGIRIWAQMHLHYRLRIHKELTLTGPYAHVRNPIYIANTLMLIGLAIMSELIWFVPVMLVWCILVYRAVVRREEAHLTMKYGAPYIAFLESVPRWLPRLRSQCDRPSSTTRFLGPSLLAEAHCLLLLIPLIGKDLFSNFRL